MIRTCKLLLLVAGLLPAQITIRAARQPVDSLRAVFDRVPSSLALEAVMVCSPTPARVSTAQIRFALAGQGLVLIEPVLGVVTAEAEYGRGAKWAEIGRELAPGGSIALAVSQVNPWVRGIAMIGSSVFAGLGKRRGRQIALADYGHLEVGPDCQTYPTLARYRKNAPEVVTVTLEAVDVPAEPVTDRSSDRSSVDRPVSRGIDLSRATSVSH